MLFSIIFLLLRRMPSKLFQRRRNEKSLRTTGIVYLVLNLAFLDTRYIIKIFIHALLVKSELNCC